MNRAERQTVHEERLAQLQSNLTNPNLSDTAKNETAEMIAHERLHIERPKAAEALDLQEFIDKEQKRKWR